MRRAAIVTPLRTPVGTFGGSLRPVSVEELAATTVRAVFCIAVPGDVVEACVRPRLPLDRLELGADPVAQ